MTSLAKVCCFDSFAYSLKFVVSGRYNFSTLTLVSGNKQSKPQGGSFKLRLVLFRVRFIDDVIPNSNVSVTK